MRVMGNVGQTVDPSFILGSWLRNLQRIYGVHSRNLDFLHATTSTSQLDNSSHSEITPQSSNVRAPSDECRPAFSLVRRATSALMTCRAL